MKGWRRKALKAKFTQEEQEKIDAYLAKHEVTQCPDSVAAVIGSSSPGWRWGQERAVDVKTRHTIIGDRKREIDSDQRSRMAARIGAPVVQTYGIRKRKRRASYAVVCQFFDKQCIVGVFRTQERAEGMIVGVTKVYGEIGARFFLAFGVPPTQYSWSETMQPLLRRQLARQRQRERSTIDGDSSGC